MIPPSASLLKYDNPLLVSKNADAKTPKVGIHTKLHTTEIATNTPATGLV